MKKNKPINMATGGLMSQPPYIAKNDPNQDSGITPYDVNTPQSARQGMPSRLLSPTRTRFKDGGESFPDVSGDGTGAAARDCCRRFGVGAAFEAQHPRARRAETKSERNTPPS